MGFAELQAAGDRSVRQLLGGSIIYTPGTGSPVTVDGIFTAAHTPVDVGEQGGGVSSVSPTCFLTVAELPSNPVTDRSARITVGAVTYRWDTNNAEPDGLGGILLRMHEVP